MELLFQITELVGTVAFAVSGAFVLGGHLAFTMAFNSEYVIHQSDCFKQKLKSLGKFSI